MSDGSQELEQEAIKAELKARFGFDIPELNPQLSRQDLLSKRYTIAEYSAKDGYLRLEEVNGDNVEYALVEDTEGQRLVGKREKKGVSFIKEGDIAVTYETFRGDRGSIIIRVDTADAKLDKPINLSLGQYSDTPETNLAGRWQWLSIRAGDRNGLIQAGIEQEGVDRSAPYSLVAGGSVHAAVQRTSHLEYISFRRAKEDPDQIGWVEDMVGIGRLNMSPKGERIIDDRLRPYEYELDDGTDVTRIRRSDSVSVSGQEQQTVYLYPKKIDFPDIIKRSRGATPEWTSIYTAYPVSITPGTKS